MKILTCILFLFVTFLVVSCGSGESFLAEKNSVPEKEEFSAEDYFSVQAAPRNNSIYVSWNIDEDYISFASIKIKYEVKNSKDEEKIAFDKTYNSKSAEYSPESGCLIQSLENGKEYKVNFHATFDDDTEISKSFELVPEDFKVEFDNATAIIYDKKVHLSWALKDFPEDYSTLAVYCSGKKLDLEEIKTVNAYEVITDSSVDSVDGTPRYSKYCSCVVKDSAFAKPSEFDFFAVNKNGTESNRFSIIASSAKLPVVELNFDLENTENFENFKNKKKVDATCSVKNCENKLVSKALTVKGRGNSSWTSAPKKSYTIKFENEQAFLGMKSGKSFALVANYFDKTLLRNCVAYELGSKIFTNLEWTPAAIPVNLFINGVYQGVYNATETNKIAKNRVNVPNLEKCKSAEEFENYGYLLEANARADESFNLVTQKGLVWSLKEPDSEDLKKSVAETLKEKIKQKIKTVEDALYSENFSNPSSADYWENYLDKNSLIDWILVSELAKNTDSNMYSSCYMYYKPEQDTENKKSASGGKFYFGPLWDFDLGFGNINDGGSTAGLKTTEEWTFKGIAIDGKNTVKAAETVPAENSQVENWILRLFESESFRSAVTERWNSKKNEVQTFFSEEKNSRFSVLKSKIVDDSNLNFRRWNELGQHTFKAPEGYGERTKYEYEIDFFTEWVSERIEKLSFNQ